MNNLVYSFGTPGGKPQTAAPFLEIAGGPVNQPAVKQLITGTSDCRKEDLPPEWLDGMRRAKLLEETIKRQLRKGGGP